MLLFCFPPLKGILIRVRDTSEGLEVAPLPFSYDLLHVRRSYQASEIDAEALVTMTYSQLIRQPLAQISTGSADKRAQRALFGITAISTVIAQAVFSFSHF